MNRSVERQIITEALAKMGPHVPATRIWGRAPSATGDMGAEGNVWAGDVHDVAVHIATALYVRLGERPLSPLAEADEAKRRRDIGAEVGALTAGYARLTSAPWYPARPGDLVLIAYELAGEFPPFGEAYAVEAGQHKGMLSLRLLHASANGGQPVEGVAGVFAVEDALDPLSEPWMEAGPHRLTIVRDGRPVHIGGAW
ncbi:hypothetical protein ACIQPR_18345 [Streptomyces sp. NPDC091280]|uniref:hypothetical protein n=1 Tax=Streptomyces sp. NPDC091280 TaxID=3365984 RepID=UPI0037FEEEB5